MESPTLRRTEMGLQVLCGGKAPQDDREIVPAEVLRDAPPWAVEFCRSVMDTVGSALKARPPESIEILPTDDAVSYSGHNSRSAFYRWTAEFGVVRSGPDRWPRARLNKGLEKEARQGGRRRKKKGGAS